MKLEVGKFYNINHKEREVTRQQQSGFVVESRDVDVSGCYEYRGKVGRKFHFYDQDRGHDIYLTKSEYENKIMKE